MEVRRRSVSSDPCGNCRSTKFTQITEVTVFERKEEQLTFEICQKCKTRRNRSRLTRFKIQQKENNL